MLLMCGCARAKLKSTSSHFTNRNERHTSVEWRGHTYCIWLSIYYCYFDFTKKRCEAHSCDHKSSAIEQWRQYSPETLSKSNHIFVFILPLCLCARIFVSLLLQREMVSKKNISWVCCNRCETHTEIQLLLHDTRSSAAFYARCSCVPNCPSISTHIRPKHWNGQFR